MKTNKGTRMHKDRQLEEDVIVDPNSFLFSAEGFTPELVMKMMASNANQGIKQSMLLDSMDKHLAKLDSTMEKLVDNDNKRTLQHQETLSNIARLDKDIERVEEIAIKALDKVDIVENTITDSCDATKTIVMGNVKEIVREAVGGIVTNAKLLWATFSVTGILFLYMFNSAVASLEKMDDRQRIIEKKNDRTYNNLEAYKAIEESRRTK